MKPRPLEQLLGQVEKAGEGEQVSLDDILDAVGRRSFGPFLLLAGLITLAPIIGDIPGVPTLMGLLVLLTTGQLLLQREHIWLPRWLLKRTVTRDKLCKTLRWLKPVGRLLDRLSRPRLTTLTQGAGAYVIAFPCLVIAAAMPPMEFVPFSANGAGAALTLFGLSLTAQDGLLALIAFLLTALTFGLVVYGLL